MDWPALKLTQKAVLLIVAPGCVVLIFLTMLLGMVKDLENDNEMASRSTKVMAGVDRLLYHAMNALTVYFLFRQSKNDLKLWAQFKADLALISEDRNAVHELSNEVPSTTNEVNALVSMIDDATYSVGERVSPDDEAAKEKLTTKIIGQFTNLTEAGQSLISKQDQLRQTYLQDNVRSSAQIRLLIVTFAAGIFLAAIGVSIMLGITFNRRLETLMTNTFHIASGTPLLPPIGGSDELSILDKEIHDLSRVLSKMRSSEQALIENTAEIICSLDANLHISQVNAAVEKVLGYTQVETLGMLVQTIVLKEDQDSTFAALDACKTSDETQFESRLRRKDGRIIDTNWTARWSEADKSIFCILHDITERKHAERLRQDVLAMVSHDLRSPLMSVGVTMEMLATGALGTLNEKGTSAITRTNKSIESLMVMINDLLELEKLQFKEFNLSYQSEDIRDLLQQSADMVAPQAEKGQVRLDVESDSLVTRMDHERIRRVIVNMLGNAIKFSPRNSKVKLIGKSIDSKWLEVQIIDQGPGIPDDKIAFVFEKFSQVNPDRETEKSGSGLGLAICKAIVDAHDGEIGVNSNPDQGSTFWFRIPIV